MSVHDDGATLNDRVGNIWWSFEVLLRRFLGSGLMQSAVRFRQSAIYYRSFEKSLSHQPFLNNFETIARGFRNTT